MVTAQLFYTFMQKPWDNCALEASAGAAGVQLAAKGWDLIAAFLSHNHRMLHGCLGLPKPCNSAKIIITMLTTMLVGALYEPP